MLDELRMLIAEVLGVSTAEVNKVREDLLEEQASADARYAATSALAHPEGSTTPLNEAYSRAQDRVASIRKKAEKALPSAFTLLLALELAEERRDEAKLHRDMKWRTEFAKDALGVDPAVHDWFGRLARHGVHPHYLKQQAEEMVAIIADLIAWKAKDARFEEPMNPWRDILRIYSGRVIDVPGVHMKPARSVPGTPARPRHRGGQQQYMFNELAAKLNLDVSARDTAAPSAQASALGAPDDMDSASPTSGTEREGGPPPRVADASNEHPEDPTDAAAADNATQVSDQTMTPERALEWAETIFEKLPLKLGVYWPKSGVDRGDYNPDKLIPALEQWISSGNAWVGPERFLDAARQGKAREFMEEMRHMGTTSLAKRLLDGDEPALADARRVGLLV